MAKTNSVAIHVGRDTLSFSIPNKNGTFTEHPYSVKTGMSMAANLRQAFREVPELTEGHTSARLIVATPPLLIPKAEWTGDNTVGAPLAPELCEEPVESIDSLYGNIITGHKGEKKIVTEIPELYVVCIFPVNSDLLMVVNDNYAEVETENIMTSTWLHLYKTYYQNGGPRRLFVFFHDKVMDVCSFEQNRIHFANSFSASHAHDALYFTLYVWKQLGMSQTEDELFVLGDMPHPEWLTERLNAYIKKVHFE